MPTYVYRFIDTGETIEIRQSFDDEPLTEAPHPSDGQMRAVKKVFTPVGITFKGSGFYKTDSGSGSSSTTSSSSAGEAAASGSGTSGSGEAGSKGSSASTASTPSSSNGASSASD